MRGLKNLIARRRPMSDPAGHPPGPQGVAGSSDPLDDRDRLHARLAPDPSAPPRNSDLDAARAARNHVPRPERPRPSPRQEWVPQTQPEPEFDDLAGLPDSAGAPRIWDLDPAEPAPPPAPASALARSAAALTEKATATPEPARPASPRVKTRLLGFHADPAAPDLFDTPPAGGPVTGSDPRFPIGWLVVIDGPGRGASFTLSAGLSTVGRDPGQTVTLDFGDTAISRERHLCIAYDDEENRTYVGHGGKANIVRLNDRPLLSTEDLGDGDTLRIGKTVLRFVAFCTGGFSWAEAATDGDGNA